MKPQTLTSILLATIALTSPVLADPALRRQISSTEKQIADLQKELTVLRSRLAASQTNTATHTVQSGETLNAIARRHHLSLGQLISLNGIKNPSHIQVGQKLIVKTSDAPEPKADSKTTTYTVQKGDTFYSIARRHKLSVSSLHRLNPDVNVSHITRGQKLVVAGKPTISRPARTVTGTPVISQKKSTAKKNTPRKDKKKTVRHQPKVEKKPAPQKKVEKKVAQAPTPQPEPVPAAPTPEVKPEPVAPASTSIILTEEMTFTDFAKKHGTTVAKINDFNGWDLDGETTLARGSEIELPR